MLSIVIVDANKNNAKQLETIIKNNVSDIVKMKHVSSETDLFSFLRLINGSINIAFIDLSYSSESDNGIEIAKKLSKDYPDIKIVFMSNDFLEYIEDIFAVNVFGCLIKPFVGEKQGDKTTETLKRIFGKFTDVSANSVHDYIAVEVRGKTKKVALSSIVLIESDKRKINIIMDNGANIDMYMKLDEFCEKLPENTFIRCHKSYCVNANFVLSMSNDTFSLTNGYAVPISRAAQPVVKRKYNAFLGEKLY